MVAESLRELLVEEEILVVFGSSLGTCFMTLLHIMFELLFISSICLLLILFNLLSFFSLSICALALSFQIPPFSPAKSNPNPNARFLNP